jgi:hypothetical protein
VQSRKVTSELSEKSGAGNFQHHFFFAYVTSVAHRPSRQPLGHSNSKVATHYNVILGCRTGLAGGVEAVIGACPPATLPQASRDEKNLAHRALEHFQRAENSLKQRKRSGNEDEFKKGEARLNETQKSP